MKNASCVAFLFSLFFFTGCASKPTATVDFSYTTRPGSQLSPQYMKIAVYEAQTQGSGDYDQDKWKSMAADMVRHHLQKAGEENNLPIQIVDREHMGIASAEADMAAAGITGGGDKSSAFADATALITTKLNVKVNTQRGTEKKVSAMGVVGAVIGRGGFGTSEVEEEARTITVQCQFQMKANDGSNAIIHSYSGPWEQHSDHSETDYVLGSSKTEADMTPRDQVIGGIVKKQLLVFTSKFLPTTFRSEVQVEASANEQCIAGVKALVLSKWKVALESFKMAVSARTDDHRALFGAGVACEKLGQYREALQYYKKARSYDAEEPKYAASVARVSGRA